MKIIQKDGKFATGCWINISLASYSEKSSLTDCDMRHRAYQEWNVDLDCGVMIRRCVALLI